MQESSKELHSHSAEIDQTPLAIPLGCIILGHGQFWWEGGRACADQVAICPRISSHDLPSRWHRANFKGLFGPQIKKLKSLAVLCLCAVPMPLNCRLVPSTVCAKHLQSCQLKVSRDRAHADDPWQTLAHTSRAMNFQSHLNSVISRTQSTPPLTGRRMNLPRTAKAAMASSTAHGLTILRSIFLGLPERRPKQAFFT